MSDKCPHCGGAMADVTYATSMLDDTQEGYNVWWPVAWRCDNCDYWEDAIKQADGTIIVKGHAPNSPALPDSCEHVSEPYKLEGGEG